MNPLTEHDDPAALPEDEIAAESGQRVASQRHLCLLEVWKAPGRTATEIAATAGLKRHVPSRRLPELRRTGHVRNGPSRVCTITGRASLVWLPTAELN